MTAREGRVQCGECSRWIDPEKWEQHLRRSKEVHLSAIFGSKVAGGKPG